MLRQFARGRGSRAVALGAAGKGMTRIAAIAATIHYLTAKLCNVGNADAKLMVRMPVIDSTIRASPPRHSSREKRHSGNQSAVAPQLMGQRVEAYAASATG
jgi:hypothetical protein